MPGQCGQPLATAKLISPLTRPITVPAADHLQVPRQHGLFLHHGIDLGDGSVAHYLEGRQILRSPREEFGRGQPIGTVAYPEGRASSTTVTLRRAMGRLGEQRYNLLFNNCEHFAHWCKTGRHRSAQVEHWFDGISVGALALGQFVPATLISGIKLLLRQGLSLDARQLEQGRALALRSLEQLDSWRLQLQQRLEEELCRAEARWGSGNDSSPFLRARLAAQSLSDQLSEVEELEQRLQKLLAPPAPPMS